MTYLLDLIVNVMVEKSHNANPILLGLEAAPEGKKEISEKQNKD